jgi:hypothetical protein
MKKCCELFSFPHNYDFISGKPLSLNPSLYDEFLSSCSSSSIPYVFDYLHSSQLVDFIYSETGVLFSDGFFLFFLFISFFLLIVVYSGSVFGGAMIDGWIRVNLATKKENVEEMCKRISDLIDRKIKEKTKN